MATDDVPLERRIRLTYVRGMEQERNEVYERIPWETLDQKKGDRQWIMFAVAGAIMTPSAS